MTNNELDPIIEEIENNTSYNHDTEGILVLSEKILKNKNLSLVLKGLIVAHKNIFGELTPGMESYRKELYDFALRQAGNFLTCSQWDRLKASF